MGDFVAMVTTISAATRFHDYRWDRRHRRGFRLGSARRPAELERDSPASLAAVRMSAMSAGKPSAPRTKPPSDNEVRALLDRYRCPMPFHVVRTRVLGNIASPDMAASPMDTVAGLWGGGELPAIDNLDALNELLRVLLMGLWNRLAGHQNRNARFRMIRVDAPETREGLANR